jgi:predicted TIM-barrel fold metal-dependent hydrolase
MVYAQGRTFYDADSHLMELSDWLVGYADPEIRDRIRPLALGGAGAMADAAVRDAEQRRTSRSVEAEFEDNVMGPKGWNALGAFDPVERSRALDLLGFDAQLVFSTFAATQFASDDRDLLYGGTRAHNRAIVDFCSADKRLIPVGYVPLTDPESAVEATREATAMGCGAVLVPSVPPKQKSPTHPDYWPIWAHLEETGVPFMLHVGGGGRPLRRAFHANGKPPITDFLGGGENIRSKDFVVLHHPPETFLACMVLDGIFEQFPGLRGGCIEQGALWVVPLLQRLDIAQDTFKRTEPALNLPLRASDYLRRQMKFTPFPTEPVGWMIEQAGPELLLFSSDYPHPEGGHDPLGRFEASLDNTDNDTRERFFSANFADMMGPALTTRI